MRLLSEQCAEHVALQRELIHSEEMLAGEGEKNRVLLEQLHAALYRAEDRVEHSVLVEMLSKYPASWFEAATNETYEKKYKSASESQGARSRSNSESGSCSIYSSSHRSLVGSRSSTPTSSSYRQTIHNSGSGGEAGIRERGGTAAGGAGEGRFTSPWKYRPNAEITARLSDPRSAGRGLYGPPDIEKRYDTCDNSTILSNSGTYNRSGSASRSRGSGLTRCVSSGQLRGTVEVSDMSTLGGSRSVRSTSASRARSAHILAKYTPPPEKITTNPGKRHHGLLYLFIC